MVRKIKEGFELIRVMRKNAYGVNYETLGVFNYIEHLSAELNRMKTKED